jgi:hypothetical protein
MELNASVISWEIVDRSQWLTLINIIIKSKNNRRHVMILNKYLLLSIYY